MEFYKFIERIVNCILYRLQILYYLMGGGPLEKLKEKKS